jgi:hypothetical protein
MEAPLAKRPRVPVGPLTTFALVVTRTLSVLPLTLLLAAPDRPATARPTVSSALDRVEIEGIVFDSLLSNAALSRAEVWAAGTTESTLTDETGHYRLSLPSSTTSYTIAATHPTWEEFGIEIRPRVVAVGSADRIRADLTSPSPKTLAPLLCDTARRAVGTALVVATTDQNLTIAGPVVSAWAEWDELLLTSTRQQVRRGSAIGRALRPTVALICGVPTDVDVGIRVRYGSSLVSLRQWVSPEVAFVRIEPPDRPPASRGVAISVRDQAGQGVQGATVGWSLDTRVRVTDPAGRTTLQSPEAADSLVLVRAVGFTSEAVRVAGDPIPGNLMVTLQRIADSLPAVRVTARRSPASRLDGFESRRRLGFGLFLTRQDVELAHVGKSVHLFQRLPGWVVDESRGQLLSARGFCPVSYFVNGSRFAGNALEAFPPDRIEAIEAYRSASETPVEFVVNDGCGAAIVIWTK